MRSGEIIVRPATTEDAARLAELGARLFYETYVNDTPAADMAAFLAQAHGIDQQTRELSDPDAASFVAESSSEFVGYVQVRLRNLPSGIQVQAEVELWRLYVDSRFHGRGIADRLMREALRAARDLGATAIWLSVWDRNARAIAYYHKHAFYVAGDHAFRVADAIYRDLVMVRRLEPATTPGR